MDIFQSRFKKAIKILNKKNIDFLLLFPSTNMYYLTGFWASPEERTIFSLLSSRGDSVFVAPEMYENQLSRQTWIKDLRIWSGKRDQENIFCNLIKEFGLAKANIALEDKTWAGFLLRIQKNIPKAKFSLASNIIKELRICKTEEELEYMKRAGKIAEEIMKEVINELDSGVRELEIAGLIEYEARKKGSGKMSFETIISFGQNSANPHNEPGQKILKKNDIVMIDFGPRYNGYCSDITRTIFKGKPQERKKKVFKIIAEAHNKAISTIKPGIKACEIDKAAREVIESYGFEKFFIHGTGHGIGLDIHEEPYITKDSSMKLKNGMTFTIEPGAYIKDMFGIRIEDSLIVTEEGCDSLTYHPKGLLEI